MNDPHVLMFKLRKNTPIHHKYASKQELEFGGWLDSSKQFQVPSKHPYCCTSFPNQLVLELALNFHIQNSMQISNAA